MNVNIPSWLRLRSVSIGLGLWLFSGIGQQAIATSTVNWGVWTAPTNLASGATGTLVIPGTTTVVNLTEVGALAGQSCFEIDPANCSNTYWWTHSWATLPTGTFTSNNVPNNPTPDGTVLALDTSTPGLHTLNFSQPLTNVVMSIWSLGSPGNLAQYQFDQPFVILSQDPRCTATSTTGSNPPANCVSQSGNDLYGREGMTRRIQI